MRTINTTQLVAMSANNSRSYSEKVRLHSKSTLLTAGFATDSLKSLTGPIMAKILVGRYAITNLTVTYTDAIIKISKASLTIRIQRADTTTLYTDFGLLFADDTQGGVNFRPRPVTLYVA